jgi:chromate reductase, NAD(P)H dehydrogenase (quinone)
MILDKPMDVCVLVGSLRKASLNGMLANALISLAPSSIEPEVVEIGEMPFYNQDLERLIDPPPAPWAEFRQRVEVADAVLFVTSEYNRSVPAVLKNALDVGSRPYGRSVWDGKPGAIVSGSPGTIGAFGANHHLRQSLVFLNVPTMQQPEAYIGQPTSSSMNTASSSTMVLENSCVSSCRRSRNGSRRSGLKVNASNGFDLARTAPGRGSARGGCSGDRAAGAGFWWFSQFSQFAIPLIKPPSVAPLPSQRGVLVVTFPRSHQSRDSAAITNQQVGKKSGKQAVRNICRTSGPADQAGHS